MAYYLRSDSYGPTKTHFDGWYTGNSYIYQGERYIICSTKLNECKSYSSENRAKLACEALNRRACNYEFSVEWRDENE